MYIPFFIIRVFGV